MENKENTIKDIEINLEKAFEIGKVQGRIETVSELIDLHDGGMEFLEALKEMQAKNGDIIDSIKKSS